MWHIWSASPPGPTFCRAFWKQQGKKSTYIYTPAAFQPPEQIAFHLAETSPGMCCLRFNAHTGHRQTSQGCIFVAFYDLTRFDFCLSRGMQRLALLDSEVGFVQLYQPVVRQTRADASTLQPAPKPTARWLGQMPILAAVGMGAAAVSKGTSQWKWNSCSQYSWHQSFRSET